MPRVALTADIGTDPIRLGRRQARFQARRFLWSYSSLDRVKRCGRVRADASIPVPVRLGDGVAHFANLQLCGSIHACPVCAPRIRHERAIEMQAAVAANLALGGAHYLLTFTLPHDQGDRLVPLTQAVLAGYRRTQQGSGWTSLRDALGIIGSIRALEVTYGVNGWHPHLHVLVFTDRTLNARELSKMRAHYRARWDVGITAAGFRQPSARRGVRLDVVADADQAAGYLAKAVVEVARGDMKKGRYGGRSPWQLLADAEATGDADDLSVWNEYEQATYGRRAIEWSRHLRARLGLGEALTDEEVVEADVGGETVGVIHPDAWRIVTAHRNGQHLVLSMVERLGPVGLPAALLALGCSGDLTGELRWRDFRVLAA